MSKGKIVITPRGFAKCGLDNVKLFEEAGFELDYNASGFAYTKEQFYEKTSGAIGVVVGVETVDKAYIDAHPTIKAIVKFGVGTDNIDTEYCKEKGIFVGRTVGSNSRSVAETAISFMLADSKNLYSGFENTKNHGWTKLTGYEVQGKTVGIIGFGAIGKEVAKMAYGLGMNIMAYDTFPIPDYFSEKYGVKITSTEDIIKNSDFVTLHIPLNENTENFISESELNTMKSNAVLINTARGGIVNENDLYFALKDNKIKSAYFDVMVDEPPKTDEKLLELPNFYLTPHIASRSAEAEKNTADIATRVIINALI